MAAPGTAYSCRRLGVTASTVDEKERVSVGFPVAVLDGLPDGVAAWPLVLAAGNIARRKKYNHRRDVLMLVNTVAFQFCSARWPPPAPHGEIRSDSRCPHAAT